MDGIYLIDKPAGISSYDCIRKLKKVLNFKKIGHSGTLDPFASGLLVVLVGKATKLANIFINDNKEYTGTIYFSKATDTYDKTGKTVEEKTDFTLSEEEIKDTFKMFQGEIYQKPPIYSAVRYGGKKLYQYARDKEEIEVKKRLVEVIEFKPLSKLQNNKLDFSATVSKGTYLRSLAYDFGKSLNIPAHLYSLRRTRSGIFNVSNAYTIDKVTSNIKPSVTIEDYAKVLHKIVVKPYLEKHILNGILLDERQTTTKEYLSVYNIKDELLAIYKPKENKYSPLIIVKDIKSF